MKTITIHLPLSPIEMPSFKQFAAADHLVILDIISVTYEVGPTGEMGASITGDQPTVIQFTFHMGRMMGIQMGVNKVRQTQTA